MISFHLNDLKSHLIICPGKLNICFIIMITILSYAISKAKLNNKKPMNFVVVFIIACVNNRNEKIFTKDYTLFNINHVPLCYYYLTFACNRSNLFRTIIGIIMSAPKCNLFHWFEVQFPKSSIVLVCPLWH